MALRGAACGASRKTPRRATIIARSRMLPLVEPNVTRHNAPASSAATLTRSDICPSFVHEFQLNVGPSGKAVRAEEREHRHVVAPYHRAHGADAGLAQAPDGLGEHGGRDAAAGENGIDADLENPAAGFRSEFERALIGKNEPANFAVHFGGQCNARPGGRGAEELVKEAL